MTRLLIITALTLCFAVPVSAETLTVSSVANDGEGSLRDALALAAQSKTPTLVVIETMGDIEIDVTLTYGGRAPLILRGAGQSITADANFTLLGVMDGADLHISNLTFQGPGGFNINARPEGRAGKGIFVDLRDDQTGTYALTLDQVTVAGVAGYGIHISDCDLADDCGGGGGGAGGGSDASIKVSLTDVTVRDVGNGSFDADGLRVDERGEGGIVFVAGNSLFTGTGADGVELDEGQAGDVVFRVDASRFEANGAYCDPDLLAAFLPSPDEGAFGDGARGKADIPGPVSGSPDDACFEREVDLYKSGSVEAYAFAIDVDDGFDVDEAGPGHILGDLNGVDIRDNLDEGADFDEEDAGRISITVEGGVYQGNAEDGIKLSEEDAGGVFANLRGVSLLSNGGKGAVFEEEDDGDVVVSVRASTALGNDDGDKTGIEVVQDDDGKGRVTLIGSNIADGMDLSGVVAFGE
ncbi:MAG: hypothetical protein HKN27_11215 [Silicimonas sp.]|nr:hypothetical protein [Silicimonas sp.]